MTWDLQVVFVTPGVVVIKPKQGKALEWCRNHSDLIRVYAAAPGSSFTVGTEEVFSNMKQFIDDARAAGIVVDVVVDDTAIQWPSWVRSLKT